MLSGTIQQVIGAPLATAVGRGSGFVGVGSAGLIGAGCGSQDVYRSCVNSTRLAGLRPLSGSSLIAVRSPWY